LKKADNVPMMAENQRDDYDEDDKLFRALDEEILRHFGSKGLARTE